MLSSLVLVNTKSYSVEYSESVTESYWPAPAFACQLPLRSAISITVSSTRVNLALVNLATTVDVNVEWLHVTTVKSGIVISFVVGL